MSLAVGAEGLEDLHEKKGHRRAAKGALEVEAKKPPFGTSRGVESSLAHTPSRGQDTAVQ